MTDRFENKWCFVPGCKNTSKNCCKRFVCVPKEKERRLKWFIAARREMPVSKTVFFCCEDHFNLEEDMQNYLRYKLLDSGRICMKPEVVPHIFDCQPGREYASESPSHTAALKQARRQLVLDAIKEYASSEEQKPIVKQESDSGDVSSSLLLSGALPNSAQETIENLTSSKRKCYIEEGVNITPNVAEHYFEPKPKSFKSIGVQTKFAKSHVCSKSIQVEIKQPMQDAAVSPFKLPQVKHLRRKK